MNKELKAAQTGKVVTINPAAQVMQSLTSALESGSLTPESLTTVLDAQERILDRQAKQEFSIDMAKCQSKMPEIVKTKYNTQTDSAYEDLGGLNKVISPVYTKHGFAVSFGMDKSDFDNMMRITAEVSHKSGFSKNYYYDLPVDNVGIKGSVNKTGVHGSASTVTYARRYLLKMIFNLITSDDIDNDGNAPEPIELLSEEQVNQIHAKITENEIPMARMMEWVKQQIKVDTLEDIPESWFSAVDKRIDSAIRAKK